MTRTKPENELKVLIITVKENYYIPMTLKSVLNSSSLEFIGITTVPPPLGNQHFFKYIYDVFRLFGPIVFIKHSIFYLKYMIIDIINRFFHKGEPYSPKTIAKRQEIDYNHVENINSKNYLEYVESKSPDIIISVAPPQKFNEELINSAKKCVVNLHSSLIPEYRGLFPNFWNLLYNEEQTGVTLHYMENELDSGDIIIQKTVPIYENDSLHDLNRRVSTRASKVLIEGLDQIRNDKVDPTPVDISEGSYYSLPTREDIKDFRNKGRSFF